MRVDPELKAKVDALKWRTDLDPKTKTTKTCRYVEAAFLWRPTNTIAVHVHTRTACQGWLSAAWWGVHGFAGGLRGRGK